jgi:hypothetical protein
MINEDRLMGRMAFFSFLGGVVVLEQIVDTGCVQAQVYLNHTVQGKSCNP